MTQNKTPDWSKWRHIPHPYLWEAVALALNVDPDKAKELPPAWTSDRRTFMDSQKFKDWSRVACENLGLPGRLSRYGRSCGVCENDRVILAQFAEWTKSVEWEIPDELAAIAKRSISPIPSRLSLAGAISRIAERTGAPALDATRSLYRALCDRALIFKGDVEDRDGSILVYRGISQVEKPISNENWQLLSEGQFMTAVHRHIIMNFRLFGLPDLVFLVRVWIETEALDEWLTPKSAGKGGDLAGEFDHVQISAAATLPPQVASRSQNEHVTEDEATDRTGMPARARGRPPKWTDSLEAEAQRRFRAGELGKQPLTADAKALLTWYSSQPGILASAVPKPGTAENEIRDLYNRSLSS